MEDRYDPTPEDIAEYAAWCDSLPWLEQQAAGIEDIGYTEPSGPIATDEMDSEYPW